MGWLARWLASAKLIWRRRPYWIGLANSGRKDIGGGKSYVGLKSIVSEGRTMLPPALGQMSVCNEKLPAQGASATNEMTGSCIPCPDELWRPQHDFAERDLPAPSADVLAIFQRGATRNYILGRIGLNALWVEKMGGPDV